MEWEIRGWDMEAVHTLLTISEARPGEHIGVVYEHADEGRAVLISFIAAGLKQGEKVRVITGEFEESENEQLAAAGLNVDAVLGRGQLSIQGALPDWRDAEAVAAWLHRETAFALAQGYTGLRLAIEDYDRVSLAAHSSLDRSEMEAGLDLGLSESLCTVLCLYRRMDLEPGERLWDLLQVHSSVVTAAPSHPSPAVHPQTEAPLPQRHQLEPVDLMILVDAEGKIIDANPRAVQFFGIDPMQHGPILLEGLITLRYPDGHPLEPADFPLSRALRGETVASERFVLAVPAGPDLVMEIFATPIREGPRITRAVSIWRNVTGRERQVDRERDYAEQLTREARRERQLLRTLIDTLPVGVIGLGSAGELLLRNPAAERILDGSVSKDGWQDKGHYTLCRLDGSPIPEDETPLRRALSRNEITLEEEILMRYDDGTEKVLSVSASPVRDAVGRPEGGVAVFQDITERQQAEREQQRLLARVEAERRRLRTLLDTLPVGVFVVDIQEHEVERNANFDAIWGYPLPKIAGPEDYPDYLEWWTHVGEPTMTEMREATHLLSRGEVSIGEVLDIRRYDGSIATVMYSSVPILDAQGRAVGNVTVVQDITPQRKLEQELIWQRRDFERLERELETILSTTDIGIVVTDREQRLIRVNRAVAEEVGTTPGALIGRPVGEIIDHTEDAEMRRRILETGESLNRSAVEYHFPVENPEPRYFDIAMAPIPDSEGNISWVLTTYKEVTAYVRAREAVELEHARLLATLATVSLPVVFIDSDGEVRIANISTEKAWQRPVIGKHWIQMISEETPLLFPQSGISIPVSETPIARALQGETVLDYEALLVLPDGKRVPVLLSATPVRVNGKIVGVIQIGQDLTRLKEADRIKDQFMAMVSHDLRSPLATIKGWALVAKENRDEETVQRALDLILKSAHLQQQLIDDLLDSAALAIGTLRVTPEVQDLRSIVELFCQSMRNFGADRNVALSWELPEEPVYAAVDAGRVQQILSNLFGNSYKFTPQDGRIEIRLFREGDEAILSVHDTGQGIPAEYLPHVFDEFYSPPGQRPSSRSLGLGLTIVKVLVEMQGGQISAFSEGPGKGSTFTARLPLADSEDAEKKALEEA